METFERWINDMHLAMSFISELSCVVSVQESVVVTVVIGTEWSWYVIFTQRSIEFFPSTFQCSPEH